MRGTLFDWIPFIKGSYENGSIRRPSQLKFEINARPPSISIASTVCSGFLVNAIMQPPPPAPVNFTPRLDGAAAADKPFKFRRRYAQ